MLLKLVVVAKEALDVKISDRAVAARVGYVDLQFGAERGVMGSATPLKLAVETEDRFKPLMYTMELRGPKDGEKPVMMGPAPVRRLLVVVALPLVVDTVMGPLVAPAGSWPRFRWLKRCWRQRPGSSQI